MLSVVVVLASLGSTPSHAGFSGTAIPLQEIDDETFSDRPISEVTIEGLGRVSERMVRNNLRTAAGQPFDAQGLRDDVATLYRLGQFETVNAEAELLNDGSVKITYRVTEQALIRDVQTVGNTKVNDQELRAQIPLYAGSPRDDFLVEQSLIRIKDLYRKKGYYLAEISVDETRLMDAGLLIYKIVEGPRVRIKEIEYIGNTSFSPSQLGVNIRTKPAIPLFRKGELDTDLLIDDTATLNSFYRDRGYLDVRVDHRVLLSPNSKDAKVVFLIDEGRQYRLNSIILSGSGPEEQSPLKIFSNEQILSLTPLRPGEVVTSKAIEATRIEIQNAYLRMGYLDANLVTRTIRIGEQAKVDLLLNINEGTTFQAGLVRIQGNFITQDKVIRRLVRIMPGRPLDGTTLETAKERIQNTQLFNDVRITVQQPSKDEQDVRDVIVEIKEKNTGSFNFGAGIGSDAGIFGEISLRQQNFDILDFPLSAEELLAGRAFMGAGQSFNISIAPGNEVQLYSVGLTEPHLFDSDVSGSADFFYRRRIYSQYDEDRTNLGFGVGRRLGNIWTGNIGLNFQRVLLKNFDPFTPVQVAADAGPDIFASVTASLRRNTIDNFMRPSRGSITNISFSRFIPIQGDVEFWAVNAGITSFLTLAEDFLGRKQILKLKTNAGYIFGGTPPTYESYYMGGRTLRGFQFRTVSPKSDDTVGAGSATGDYQPIGGSWEFFAGAQYEYPIFAESLAGVLFVDSGTVTNTPGFSEYRVSVGFGIRLSIPQLGPAPLAFDFGFPILKQENDETQLFSFTAELPF